MKTIRRLGLHERESKSLTDGLTYTYDSISGYASEAQAGSDKNETDLCLFCNASIQLSKKKNLA